MKFIHIADVHLGAKPDAGSAYSANRKNEIWETFRSVIEKCEKEKVDLLLIAGDLFHRQPLLRELKEVDYLFSTLNGTQVVLIAGNHDYMRKNSYYRTFTWSSNVHMITGASVECVELKDLDLAVYGLSYHEKEIREALYDQIRITDRCKYHILLAHGGDESHIPFRKEVIDRLGFDYVALGHLHNPQKVGQERIRYCGTPLKYSFSEVHSKKSVTVVSLQEKGNLQIRTVPLQPRHDLQRFRGRFEELLKMGSEDYVQLTLTDETEIPHAYHRLREKYPRIMVLDYDNTRTRTRADFSGAEKMRGKSEIQLFSELFRQQNGREMDERQTQYMEKLLRELKGGEEE